MNEEKKEAWGGARSGAGRKASGKKYQTTSVSAYPDEWEIIKADAKATGKTPSRYLIDLALMNHKTGC